MSDQRIVVVREPAQTVAVAAVGARGPIGATGPQGATGPEGPQGPAGEVTTAQLDAAVAGTATLVRTDYAVNHTLVEADLGKRLRFTAVATLTIPADATANLTQDRPVEVYAAGGAVTIAGAAGVTVRGGTSLAQFASASVIKDGPNVWVVVGGAT